ncbi:uncharacterized protein LOC129772989 [Toxorhynchites rutilus septentrionalis]|uniref:uncharacterized protein LOC129772989 n=1 Tax=Toxorhynchites rutilus septentrionalis TaxID=329112 RepID=UPI0024785C56|nr:uncharacterized protein LOC129772989 [Toxorhynchites rutilus septentrionalis]
MRRGFVQSKTDPCLYIRNNNGVKMYLLVYVDDYLLGSSIEEEIHRICESLSEEFEITCLGGVRHFLGMEFQQEYGVYQISLSNYIDNLIEKYGVRDAKTARSPMDIGYPKQKEQGKLFEDATKYRSLIGGQLYISVNARPDIAACTAILGRKVSAPSESDWTAAKRVLRYLKGTKHYELQLGGNQDQQLAGYSDADWAGDIDTSVWIRTFVRWRSYFVDKSSTSQCHPIEYGS